MSGRTYFTYDCSRLSVVTRYLSSVGHPPTNMTQAFSFWILYMNSTRNLTLLTVIWSSLMHSLSSAYINLLPLAMRQTWCIFVSGCSPLLVVTSCLSCPCLCFILLTLLSLLLVIRQVWSLLWKAFHDDSDSVQEKTEKRINGSNPFQSRCFALEVICSSFHLCLQPADPSLLEIVALVIITVSILTHIV
jgi:hypothetical protein